MSKFRKKPVVVEAMHYNGANVQSVIDWAEKIVLQDGGESSLVYQDAANDRHLTVETLEGDMRADPGCWIICGVKGEFYPCKPDIFEATYERVES